MIVSPTIDKAAMFFFLLERVHVVSVAFNAYFEGVSIPRHVRAPVVVLQYGRSLNVPVREFVVDERGISAILSFGGSPAHTFVPWASVLEISDGGKLGRSWVKNSPLHPDTKSRTIPEGSPTPDAVQPPAQPQGEGAKVIPLFGRPRKPTPA